MSGHDSKYFSTTKKGEIPELKEELNSQYKEEQNQKWLKELKEKATRVIIRKMPSQDLRRTNSMEW